MKGNKVRIASKGRIVCGVLAFFPILIVLLSMASVLTVKGIIKEQHMEIVVCVCSSVASLLSGFIVSYGKKNFLFTVATVGAELVLILFCGLLWKGESHFSGLFVCHLCCIVIPTFLAAFLSGNPKHGGKKSIRRR